MISARSAKDQLGIKPSLQEQYEEWTSRLSELKGRPRHEQEQPEYKRECIKVQQKICELGRELEIPFFMQEAD